MMRPIALLPSLVFLSMLLLCSFCLSTASAPTFDYDTFDDVVYGSGLVFIAATTQTSGVILAYNASTQQQVGNLTLDSSYNVVGLYTSRDALFIFNGQLLYQVPMIFPLAVSAITQTPGGLHLRGVDLKGTTALMSYYDDQVLLVDTKSGKLIGGVDGGAKALDAYTAAWSQTAGEAVLLSAESDTALVITANNRIRTSFPVNGSRALGSMWFSVDLESRFLYHTCTVSINGNPNNLQQTVDQYDLSDGHWLSTVSQLPCHGGSCYPVEGVYGQEAGSAYTIDVDTNSVILTSNGKVVSTISAPQSVVAPISAPLILL